MINLLKALIIAKSNFLPLRKDKKANYGKYASLDAVLDSVELALLNQGLILSHQLVENNLVTTLYHVSGEKLESIFTIGEVSDPQKLGSKLTYFRRYAICGMLSICADEDDDGQATKAQLTTKAVPANKPQSNSAEIMQSTELITIKKMFMDLAKEKGVKNVAEWVSANVNSKPSVEWALTDWELAIERVEKLEVTN
jgi:hypothetical protein